MSQDPPSAPDEVAVVDFGPVHAHAVTIEQALALIVRRALGGRGGFVLTPNVDHISMATRDREFAAAYQRCFLALVDGMPLVAMSRLLGLPVAQKISGSDLFEPLMAQCARHDVPVFFLGATETACQAAERRLLARHPLLRIVGHDSSWFDLDRDANQARAVLQRARDAGARLIVTCLPPRKQAAILCRFEAEYRPAVGIGVGSALSFYVGEIARAPAWMSRAGLEWLHRLGQEPRRLWRRYLVEGFYAVPVFARMARDRLAGRPVHRICKPLL